VILGLVSIALEKSTTKKTFRDQQDQTARSFKRLFPRNDATIDKLIDAFKDLDADQDGVITSAELCFGLSQATGADLRSSTVDGDRISEWMLGTGSPSSKAGGQNRAVDLVGFLEHMICILVESGGFWVRTTAPPNSAVGSAGGKRAVESTGDWREKGAELQRPLKSMELAEMLTAIDATTNASTTAAEDHVAVANGTAFRVLFGRADAVAVVDDWVAHSVRQEHALKGDGGSAGSDLVAHSV
jgi:hypothetical protein